MKAAIDIGSNTVRMLIGEVADGQIVPLHYYRHLTRLGGGYDPVQGISAEGRERTLSALVSFADAVQGTNLTGIRAVATEAVRRAVNAQQFVEEVLARTGFIVEIVDGEEEASLSSAGVLAGLKPRPVTALIFDVGGGSTEFIIIKDGERLWQKSYPLGVISLAEAIESRQMIERVLTVLAEDLRVAGMTTHLASADCALVGTAGTVTTLAAIDLAMTEYDWQRINNYLLPQTTLHSLYARLLPLNSAERELIAGVEKGRGDLILPGLEIVLALLTLFGKDRLRVSDFGLLEGVLLSLR